ncbi:Transducin-like enhancer protein 4 [Cichlidogyrus casuarinus]|uniref:Transducin-like enhancer protein 4 n=1 Tax=Cichlidogyrus casuarinus TaxID=1844966 RepID=A0ABD2PZS3_9PLAT
MNFYQQMDSGMRGGKAPYSFALVPGPDDQLGPPMPVPLTPDMFNAPGIPRSLKVRAVLEHGEVVCAVTMHPSESRRTIFTGGRGAVKLWDASFLDDAANSPNSLNGNTDPEDPNATPRRPLPPTVLKNSLTNLECLPMDSYIRSIKLSKDGKTLIVGGESNLLSIWDLGGATPMNRGVLNSNATACYALTLSPDGRLCYSCTSEGQVCVWDVCNQALVKQFQAHADGASCVDLCEQQPHQLWTGGLDKTVHCWDVREASSSGAYPLHNYAFPSQVFSLGYSGEWLAVGLEKRLIEMIAPGMAQPRYQLAMHENCVLSLRFANSRSWFVSTGKDHYVNAWRSPFGANLCQVKENSSVLSCDISSDDRLLITGSGEMRATIYDVLY